MLVLLSCNDPILSPQTEKKEAAAITVKICACMAPLIALNQEAKALTESDDPAAVAALLAKLQQAESVHDEAKDCLRRLKPEFKSLTDEQKKGFSAQIQANCPESAGQGELLEVVLE